MPRTVFAAIGTCVPPRVVTNRELTTLMDTTDEWIRQRTGVEERRWVEPGVGASDLACEAAKRALAQAGWQASDVQAIVYATLSSDHMFPGDGCFLNAKLGIPGVPALDIRNQCTGFLYGLSIADAWIKSGQYQRVLLVGSEVHSTGLDVSTRGRDTAVIFGDGAGAVLLEASDDPARGVLSTHLHADGRFARDLWTDAPGSVYSPRANHAQIDSGAVFPHMEGQKVFKHAVVKMPEVLREAFERNGLGPADVKLLVPHQANLRISEMVQRSLGLSDAQVFNNIQKYGNTTAASIPLCLAEGVVARGVQKGDLVALAAFGAGFTWASALVRW
ncbi:MAG TPA: beta-ketoacyl-ACP synthase III [Anaeromyxobacteraceae bacterium]|jgi:3-oxoacyl-[acyl-carrier-protein] synthase-3|nr:beta-ketoacyl-ACP synthase III [Anaeromyxobacteraceae bacterium]